MELKIYNNNSNTNVLNKNITLVSTLDFSLKIGNSILQPVLILKNYSSGNYCYIEKFKRYYYITDIKLLTGGLYQIQLEVDVLMTYNHLIKKKEVFTSY